MSNVVQMHRFAPYGPVAPEERRRLAVMFRRLTRSDLRRMWDGVGDDSFYHGPEGDFDCEDIHGYMNMIGDGEYCAV